jgi:hypothetical protein
MFENTIEVIYLFFHSAISSVVGCKRVELNRGLHFWVSTHTYSNRVGI